MSTTFSKTGILQELGGIAISAKVGSRIFLRSDVCGTRTLRACDWWSEKADFAWDVFNGGPIKEVAVNVFVTGRTRQRRHGEDVIRVKVEFVGDGEPSEIVDGWMFIDGSKQEYL